MGASLNNTGNARRRRQRHVPLAEINVTPFVDVMLVLLIVFMVSAPLLTVGVPIELPETKGKELTTGKEPLTLSVRKDGKIFLQDKEITAKQLVARLKEIAKSGYNEPIYVRGDRRTDYGTVMKVMGRLSAAGFKRISLVTEAEQS